VSNIIFLVLFSYSVSTKLKLYNFTNCPLNMLEHFDCIRAYFHQLIVNLVNIVLALENFITVNIV